MQVPTEENRFHPQPSRNHRGKVLAGALGALAATALTVSPAFAQTTTTEDGATTTTAAETTTTEAGATTTTAAQTTTTADTDSGKTPAGGADTGAGGTATDDGIEPLAVAGVAVLAAAGAGVALRRRGAAAKA